MKFAARMIVIAVIIFFSISVVSCTYLKWKKGLPPGQEKKIYGQQSAAPFAPGHD
jgi:hypothetical protein